MEPIFVMQSPEIWSLLVFLLPFVFAPMFFFSHRIPSLVTVGHVQTKWIDGLRGVAAALVAMNHAPFVLVNLTVVSKVFVYDPVASGIPSLFGAFGVQLFFCITGFLFAGKALSQKNVDWSEFYEKRVRRTVPAYFAAAVLALIVATWFSWPIVQPPAEIFKSLPAVFGFKLVPLPIINDFDFRRLIGVAWTLGVEWKFYLILPILYIAARKSLYVTLLVIVGFAIMDLWLTGLSPWSFFIPGVFSSFVASKQFGKLVRNAAGVIALFALFFMFCRVGQKTMYGLEQWVTVFVVFVALTISRPKVLSFDVLVAMGTVSYSFYLLHCMILFVVLGVINSYWVDISLLSIRNFVMLVGLTLSFCSVLSVASFVFIERRFMHKPNYAQIKEVYKGVQPT
jgi:peptidoglycan/LPS O-acetylase OafA/YrhL